MFNIYVANLGAYNRGHLVGKWLELPMDSNDLQNEIDEILNGEEAIKTRDYEDYEDEEIAIHDYEANDFCKISEYDSVWELNELAEKIEEYEDSDLLKAIIETGNEADIEAAINNINDYYLHPDIQNDYDVGYYYVNETGGYDLESMGSLANYIDYESLGRDIGYEGYNWHTSYGWLEYHG